MALGDNMLQGVSRSLALGRILYFESFMRRRLGEVRAQRYIRLYNYYSGQNLPPDNVDQPLGINYVARICDKHTSYLWGQYKRHVVDFRISFVNKDDLTPEQKQEADQIARRIKKLLYRILFEENHGDRLLDKAALNGAIYGDSVFEVSYDETQRRVKIETVLPEYFHCMWDITDMARLYEVIVAYPIDRSLAAEQWGSTGNDQFLGYQAINPNYTPGIGILWKRWSTTSFQVWVDDVCVRNEPNPYMPMDDVGNIYPGVIPFVHIPNLQAGSEYYGYGDAEPMLLIQDEINRRVADMGDIVSNHAHPIVTLKHFSGDQNDLPVGPDAIWDLGKDGEADRLEGTGPGAEAMDYLDQLKQIMHDTSNIPAIAYGSMSSGGGSRGMSHTAGSALSIAFMPILERAMKKRILWKDALKQLCQMIFYLLYVRDPDLLASYDLSYPLIQLFEVEPLFADILPKDELQNVNEQVALTSNMLRSIENALEQLGMDDIPAEMQRIQQDAQLKASLAMPTPPASGGTAGKNSDKGQGGSNQLPGGIGGSAGKPGVLIKSPDLDTIDNVGLESNA